MFTKIIRSIATMLYIQSSTKICPRNWSWKPTNVALCALLVALSGAAQSAMFDKGARVVILNENVNDFAHSASRNEVYATVPSAAGIPNGNSILTFNSNNGAFKSRVFAGSEPTKIAVSDDGSRAYVGIDGARAFRSWQPGTDQFSSLLPLRVPISDPAIAQAIDIAPGRPDIVIVARDEIGSSASGELEIFRNNVSFGTVGSRTDADQFSFVDSETVIAYNDSSTGFDLVRYGFNPNTLTLTQEDAVRGLISGFSTNIKVSDNLIFASNGIVVDPFTLVALGTYITGLSSPAVEAVPTLDTTFFLGRQGNNATLKLFDFDTFLQTESIDLGFSLFSSVQELKYLGENRFAFLTSNGTLGMISAVPLPAPLLLLISALFSVGVFSNKSGRNSSKQLVSSFALLVSTGFMMFSAPSATAKSLSDGFEVTILAANANDIAFNSARNELYATISSAAGFPNGNSIVTYNPYSGAQKNSVFAGSEPTKLKLSRDGGFAYVGINGARAFRSWVPGTSQFGELISLANTVYGPAVATDFAISPNDPNSVVVARNVVTSSANGYLGGFRNGELIDDLTRIYVANEVEFLDSTTLLGVGSSVTRWHYNAGPFSLTQEDSVRSLVSSRADFTEDLIYSTSGIVVDANTFTAQGTYNTGLRNPAVEAVSSLGNVYYLGSTGYSSGPTTLKIFDQQTFLEKDAIDLGMSLSTVLELTHLGDERFAFLTGSGAVGIIAPVPLPGALLFMGSAIAMLFLTPLARRKGSHNLR